MTDLNVSRDILGDLNSARQPAADTVKLQSGSHLKLNVKLMKGQKMYPGD